MDSLLGELSPRQNEIITGRFGLGKFKKAQTLAALGKKYDITRERVRQIEAGALNILKGKINSSPDLVEVIRLGKNYLKNSGGVASRDQFLAQFSASYPTLTENHYAVLLASTKEFFFRGEDEEFIPFYYLDAESLASAENFIDHWEDAVSKKKEAILAGSYEEELRKTVKVKNVSLPAAQNYLSISKKFFQNPYGDRGLAQWPEIRPSTVRDRIYLVLKKSGKPLHFETIAEMINKAGFDNRLALAPTVHNELIKDTRFILVGRGIYGLAEHGYVAGTAREVIARILENEGPLKPREVISAVQRERFLKPNTVLVNLQNKSFFERMPDGKYKVREA